MRITFMGKLAFCGGDPVRKDPFPEWPRAGKEEKAWLEKVLSGNRWFAGLQGDDPEALGTLFGERFARLHGAKFALPVANGSVAIEVALRAGGIGTGDEVIVPAYTFISTATSVLMVGAVPVFADIEPETYCLNPLDIEHRITEKTRAIIPVHLGGQVADMASIMPVAKEHGLLVVEDCAQAINSARDGKKAGNWGKMGTFSFQSNKTVTCGEGGLIMTNDQSLAEKVTALRAFGRFGSRPGARSSDLTCERLSSNYRLSEFQAAVLLGQLERLPQEDNVRQTNAERLTKAIHQIPGLKHIRVYEPSIRHGYYYYLVRYEPASFNHADPEKLCAALNAEGIPFVPGDRKPLYRHPVFKPENLAGSLCPEVLEQIRHSKNLQNPECPVSEEACNCTLLLRHQVLLGNEKDMDDIAEAFWKVHKNIDELG